MGVRAFIRLGLVEASYVAVCDVDEKRARAFSEAAGVPIATTDPFEVIDSPDVDAVYICVPTSSHKELVLRAAARGKHVFCEKPLATNLADVEEMVSAVESAGVSAGVGLILRHSPILHVLKSLTDDPMLGRLMLIVFRDDQFFPIQGHYASDWRKDREQVGSGTLLEHSIHDADVLLWLGGPAARVSGATRNFAGYEGVEDLAVARLEFANGAEGQLSSIWHSVLGRPSTRCIEVFYEKGVFAIDHDFLGPVYLQTHAQNAEVIPEDEVRRRYLESLGLTDPVFSDLLRYSLEGYFFLKALADGRAPFPDFRVALEAHRVVDGVYRSAAAVGATVPL